MADENLKRLNEISSEIAFHKNTLALHQKAIRKLLKEKSEIISKGWERQETKNGR